jgi:flagellar assembly protein FliH
MPWSNTKQGFTRAAGSVLSKEVAEQTVLEFVPIRLDLGTPEHALNYISEKKKGSGFRMNDIIKSQTGIDQIESTSDGVKVEKAALEKLKEIQESAYQEAFKLGQEEGRKQAFEHFAREIEDHLVGLDTLMNGIKDLKMNLVQFNETHFINLLFQMASRLAKTSLEGNNEAMVQILREAVSLSQDDENITVRVSANQFNFLEELKNATGRDLEFVKRIRFESSDEVADGGCIVETNYGEVDARIEKRIEQLWIVVNENLPPVKERIAV